MSEYETVWSCYVEADSPEDAALVAKAILQDPGNEAWSIAVDDGATIFHYDVEDSAEPYEWMAPTTKEKA